MSAKKPTSVAKKIAGKRRWYFRYKKITLKTVLKNISFYTKPWFYAGKPLYRNIVISRNQVKDLAVITGSELSENRSSYVRLTILDVYILYRWINLGLVDFSKFKGFKMYAFDCPLVKSQDHSDPDNYHYLCLEQNPLYPDRWDYHVRSRQFITRIPEPYLVLCRRVV